MLPLLLPQLFTHPPSLPPFPPSLPRHLPPERQKVTAVPEVEIHERHHDKDEILLLACDGVWDVCENEEAGQILKEVLLDGEKRMALMAEELLDQCLMRYSKDNISAVVVGFEKMSRHEKEGEGGEGDGDEVGWW